MKTIVLACSKGGVGKTSVSACFAVEAARRNKVALRDVDPQQSLARWFELRSNHKNMELLPDKGSVADAIKSARGMDCDYLLVDSPPALMWAIEPAVKVADLVVIPCRPSPIDVESTDPIVELCEMHGVPFVFLINAATTKTGITVGAIKYLSEDVRTGEKRTVLPDIIMQRQAYLAAMASGQSGVEIDKTGKAAEEIVPVWKSIVKILNKQPVKV